MRQCLNVNSDNLKVHIRTLGQQLQIKKLLRHNIICKSCLHSHVHYKEQKQLKSCPQMNEWSSVAHTFKERSFLKKSLKRKWKFSTILMNLEDITLSKSDTEGMILSNTSYMMNLKYYTPWSTECTGVLWTLWGKRNSELLAKGFSALVISLTAL